ncbi:hypothetical protein L596_001025 [Steinernema carpocapsae]|uniref:RGS domain-containing protein n=1 Tax=Steinernema carpocapsae TaxID=34508 RepID=A0A4U8UM63_STECR|nr:hypothetical protein L596_001025 [Steinernema carpocapsae]
MSFPVFHSFSRIAGSFALCLPILPLRRKFCERRRRSAELTIPSGSSQGSSPSPTCHHRLSPNEWTFAFDSMIRSEDGRLAFTDFLKSEYSDENIMFWWAVQQLRSSNANEDEFACQVRQMYDLYIAADSPHAINIDHDTRTEIIDRVEGAASAEPFPEDIYDRAQTHVYRLMEKDCFSRFVHTATYKELAKKLHLPQSFRFNGRTSPL